MEEIQGIEKFLEKLHQLMIVKGMDKLTLMAKGARYLDAGLREIETIKERSPKQSGKQQIFSISSILLQHQRSFLFILDSGASTYVTGRKSEFASYATYPPTHKETIQSADGTYHPFIGVSKMHFYYKTFSLICSIIFGEFGVYELLG
jgi:hypothetical protein